MRLVSYQRLRPVALNGIANCPYKLFLHHLMKSRADRLNGILTRRVEVRRLYHLPWEGSTGGLIRRIWLVCGFTLAIPSCSGDQRQAIGDVRLNGHRASDVNP